MNNRPFVSVVVPCLNERDEIENCLESLAANDYPHDRLEILVVDGMSEDGTRDIVREMAGRLPFIRLVDNPRKIIPAARNAGIRNAKGEFVMIADAHAWYPKDYISKCIAASQRYGAENVGGVRITEPKKKSLVGKAIAYVLSHWFGAGTAAYHHRSSGPRWVDTVWAGCFRRELFERIGLFNENLPRCEDREFNQRLRDCGGRILQVPDIFCVYHCRSTLREFYLWMFRAGMWVFWGSRISSRRIFSLRNLAPATFVAMMLLLLALSILAPPARWALVGIVAAYGSAGLACAFPLALKEQDPRYLLVLPLLFATSHVVYAIGSWRGILRPLPGHRGEAMRASREGAKRGARDYANVSEAPGIRVTHEAVSMLRTRYSFAARFCRDKDVLEVGCGAGLGLGLLAHYARRVVGADCTESLLRLAAKHHKSRVPLVRLDAHSLPFRKASFDVVVVFEAIYYFAQVEKFLEECRRVLRPQGVLLLSSANNAWPGFVPSWLSQKYFSAQDLRGLLSSMRFDPQIFGGFPSADGSWQERTLLKVRRLAVRSGGIPRTMKGKESLKRLFYGPLVLLGDEIDGDPSEDLPVFPIDASSPTGIYKVVYAVATLKPGDLTGPAP